MNDLRSTLQNTYHDIIDAKMDSKSMTYWEKSIQSRSKTLDDFREHVLSSLEYKKHVSDLFKKEYYDCIGYDLPPTVLKDFLNGHENEHVTQQTIRQYVTSLETYEKKCKELVQKVYSKVLNVQSTPDSYIQFYLDRFKSLLSYDIEQLYNDISNLEHERPKPTSNINESSSAISFGDDVSNHSTTLSCTVSIVSNDDVPDTYDLDAFDLDIENTEGISDVCELDELPINSTISDASKNASCGNSPGQVNEQQNRHVSDPKKTSVETLKSIIQTQYKKSHGTDIPDDKLCQIQELYSDPSKLLACFEKGCETKNIENDCYVHPDLRAVEEFEAVFKRPMFVHEYYKYVITQNKQQDFLDLHASFVTTYNRTRRILYDYTNVKLDEYSFVKTYLHAADDEGFFDTLIDDIVTSKEYRDQMFDVLKIKYENMYKETLEFYDIEYVFRKVLKLKCSLHNEELDDILVQLKEETDEIIGHICQKYNKILERDPDVFEIAHYVRKYRLGIAQQSIDAIDAITEKDLINTLEFHDILKKQIKLLCPSMTQRVLYNHLKKLLVDIDQQTFDSMNEKVQLISKASDE